MGTETSFTRVLLSVLHRQIKILTQVGVNSFFIHLLCTFSKYYCGDNNQHCTTTFGFWSTSLLFWRLLKFTPGPHRSINQSNILKVA